MFLSQELLTEGQSEKEHSLQLSSSKCLQKDIFLVSEYQTIQMVWILHSEENSEDQLHLGSFA